MRRRRLPPPPEQPPEGMMLFKGALVPIVEAERQHRKAMQGFDCLPPDVRRRLQCVQTSRHIALLAKIKDEGLAPTLQMLDDTAARFNLNLEKNL